MNAQEIFEKSLNWLKENYENFDFFRERDIVWTLQNKISDLIKINRLNYKVYEEYPILPGNNRSVTVDLAIMEKSFIPRQGKLIEVVAEFKYEPSKLRENILGYFYSEEGKKKTRFPIIFYNNKGIKKDIIRIKDYISKGLAKTAYLIFFDEGKQFRHKKPFEGSEWKDWKMKGIKFNKISILWMKIEKKI